MDKATPDAYALPWTPEELAALPHDNKAPRLLTCIWVLLGVATVFMSMRIYCRLVKGQRLWWDDIILIASWVCILIESALLTHITTLGYGLHIWDFDPNNFQPVMLPTTVAVTFAVTAAVWSKTSFGFTLLKITDGWIKKFAWFCIISMNIAMGVAALMPWVSCAPIQKVWDLSVTEGSCWDIHTTAYYDIFAGGYSALMDITLALLPWKFLWGLQMKPKEKIGVGIAMSMGVFAGATAIVKTAKVPLMLSADFADGVDLWIWGNAEVCASIIAASIPMLRVLVRDAKSSRNYPSGYYGGGGDDTAVTGNYSRFVSVTGSKHPSQRHPAAGSNSEVELHKMGDDGSDRSILGGNGGGGGGERVVQGLQPPQNGIVQVTDFTVKYDAESDAGVPSSSISAAETRTG